jgi:tRNA pseudouridine13 synthase
MNLDPLAPLPLLTADLPGVGGRIKQEPEDFEVEEIPAYEPCGTGDFLYLWVEKRDMGAEYFSRQVARRLGLAPGDVGMAGLKDRHAVTRQWVSVPAAAEGRLAQLEGDGIRLLSTSRHGNKLKPGHLRGNRFRILIRDPESDAAGRLPPLLDRVRQNGVPNFFGPQRFGRDGETAQQGLALLRGDRGRRLSSFLRRLALSAAQSLLFNHYLAQRMQNGLFRSVLPGDVMAKWPSGGLFRADDVPTEQARFDRRETVHTGPIFGRKTFEAGAGAAAREAAVLETAGLTPTCFHGFGKLVQGTRRHNLVYADDLTAAAEPDCIRITVTLPAGSYATVLLRELTHAAHDDPSPDAS